MRMETLTKFWIVAGLVWLSVTVWILIGLGRTANMVGCDNTHSDLMINACK